MNFSMIIFFSLICITAYIVLGGKLNFWRMASVNYGTLSRNKVEKKKKNQSDDGAQMLS